MVDVLTRKQRSYCMSRIKAADTKGELLLRSLLHRLGLRFRKNVRTLPGKPDVVFVAQKVAVFLDGDFWHGRNFPVLRKKLSVFWKEKLEANIYRDRFVERELEKRGWKTIRIWETDFFQSPLDFVLKVTDVVRQRS